MARHTKSKTPRLSQPYTRPEAVEVWSGRATVLGFRSASHREEIRGQTASSPSQRVSKLVHVYAIGSEICVFTEDSAMRAEWKGYTARIYVRDPDTWKIRMAYSN